MVRIPFGPEPEIPGRCREIDSSRDTRKARRDRFQPRKKKGVCKQLQLMMRSLQHSRETLPADPCRIILRPPSVKFIKKEKRKTKKTMDRRCRYSVRTPRSILDPFMPRIEREIGSVNVEDAFDSSSNRSFPIIVGRPFKKGEKKIPDENSSPPILSPVSSILVGKLYRASSRSIGGCIIATMQTRATHMPCVTQANNANNRCTVRDSSAFKPSRSGS